VRYGVFEEAANEASLGVKEIDCQLEQISARMEELKSKKALLETLSRQLLTLASEGAVAGAEAAPAAADSQQMAERPALDTPEKVDSSLAVREPEPVMAVAAVDAGGPTPEGWFSRRYTSGIRSSGIFAKR
jgi:hypothetical protein